MEQTLITGKAIIYKNIEISEEHKLNINKMITDHCLTDIHLDNNYIKSIHKGYCNLNNIGSYKITLTNMAQLIGLHMIFVYLQNFYGLFGEVKLKFHTSSEDNLTSPSLKSYNKYFEKNFGFEISGIQLFGKSSKGKFTFIAVPKKIYDSRHLFCWDGFNIDLFKLNLTPEKMVILNQNTNLSELKKDRVKLHALYSFHSDDIKYLKDLENKYVATITYLKDSIAKVSTAPKESLLSKEDIIYSLYSSLENTKELLIKDALEYFVTTYNFKFNIKQITNTLLNLDFSSENIAFEIEKTLGGINITNAEAKTANIKYFLENNFKEKFISTDEWNNSITFFEVFDCSKEYASEFFNKRYLEDILISLDISEFNNIPKSYIFFRNTDIEIVNKRCKVSTTVDKFNFKKEIIHPYVKEIEFNNSGKITFKFINNTLMKKFKELFNI